MRFAKIMLQQIVTCHCSTQNSFIPVNFDRSYYASINYKSESLAYRVKAKKNYHMRTKAGTQELN
jgi:hypothetical protein